jgi:hypothetical protein
MNELELEGEVRDRVAEVLSEFLFNFFEKKVERDPMWEQFNEEERHILVMMLGESLGKLPYSEMIRMLEEQGYSIPLPDFDRMM